MHPSKITADESVNVCVCVCCAAAALAGRKLDRDQALATLPAIDALKKLCCHPDMVRWVWGLALRAWQAAFLCGSACQQS
jgi:hypothetical protein